MRDPALEEAVGRWAMLLSGRGFSFRCPICGCIPRVRMSHAVKPELPYQMLSTCDSAYCQSRDDIRFPIKRGA